MPIGLHRSSAPHLPHFSACICWRMNVTVIISKMIIWEPRLKSHLKQNEVRRRKTHFVSKIEDFLQNYNANTKPFSWTAKAESILKKIERLCERICGTKHKRGSREKVGTVADARYIFFLPQSLWRCLPGLLLPIRVDRLCINTESNPNSRIIQIFSRGVVTCGGYTCKSDVPAGVFFQGFSD